MKSSSLHSLLEGKFELDQCERGAGEEGDKLPKVEAGIHLTRIMNSTQGQLPSPMPSRK